MKLKITSIATICICICISTLSYGQSRKTGKFNLPEQIKIKKETTKQNLDHHHLFVSNTNSNKRNVNLLPTKGYQLKKDNVFSSNWDYVHNLTHTRDNEGRIIKTVYLDTVNNDDKRISLYTYNNNGKETSNTNINKFFSTKDSVMYHPIYTNFKIFEMSYEKSGSNEWEMDYGTRTFLSINAGKIQSKITERFNSFENDWILDLKSTYTYNSNGQLIGEIETWFDGNDSMLSKYTFEYNDSGDTLNGLSEEWDEFEQDWIKLEKYEIAFNKLISNFEYYFILEENDLFEDRIIENMKVYLYENETWQLSFFFEVNYNGDNYESYLHEYYSDDDTSFLMPSFKEIFEKTGNTEITTSLYYDIDLADFVYSYRLTIIKDLETSENISDKGENWDEDTKRWIINSWQKTTKSFDTQERLLSITKSLWSGEFFDVDKTIYTYWGPIIPGNTSIKLLKSNQHTISLYPNPCSDILFLEIKDGEHQRKNIAIKDLTGKTILNYEFIGNTHEINLESLSSGMYLIDILINNEFETHKFIKQ